MSNNLPGTLLILFCLCGLHIFATNAEPIRRGGTLVVGLRAEPKTLNPLTSLDTPSRDVIGRMNADLISTDRQTQLYAPALAETWSVTADGKHYTLNLRKNILFSDGQPFDADDVVFSFQAYLDERTHSPQRDLLIINGSPIQVVKLDQFRVRFDLPSPYSTTLRIFDGLAMLPRHLLQKKLDDGSIAKAWTLNTPNTDVAGLGPFRLKEYRPGDRLILERNPFYRKAGQPYLDKIEFLFVGDEDAQLARFVSGETDLINRVSARNEKLLRSRGMTVTDVGPSLEYNFLFFNLTAQAAMPQKAWFESRAFRQAISAAIDRQSLVKLVYSGLATPLSTHVAPSNRLWAAPQTDSGMPSPDKARGLLRDAGFTWDQAGSLKDGSGHPVEFTILCASSNAERSQMATLVQDDLKKIGITVHVVSLEFRSMVDRILKTHEYDAAILGLGAGDGDPNSEMNVWLSSGGMHVWNPQQQKPATAWEAEIDSLMHKQEVEMDFNARRRLYLRILQIEADQLPIISLVSPHVLVAQSNRVHNLRPSILDHYTLWNADELFVTPVQPRSEQAK